MLTVMDEFTRERTHGHPCHCVSGGLQLNCQARATLNQQLLLPKFLPPHELPAAGLADELTIFDDHLAA